MKTFVSLVAALSGLAFAATPADPGAVPEGLVPSEWSDLRAAYEAGRHAAHRQENGHLTARNPGQQWRAEFDGKGFTVNPDHGTWTWGLELTGYGDRKLQSTASSAQLRHEGGKIISQRDENLTEWFVNDSRGLEQGWDIQQRPERADPAAPLQLHLSTRGNIIPQVSASGDSVSFQREGGGSALTYGGLKAWDADGSQLPVRFELTGGKHLRIAVDDRSARYPITIDPVAQQTFLQASNKGYRDYFGKAVAISGDTVAIGAYGEDSAATGVNGDQTGNGAMDSGAVYIFVRSGTGWTQQAYLKASNTGEYDNFGACLAISGDTVVVGAGDDSDATGVNGDQTNHAAPGSGAVYVFTRNGTVWSQQAYLKASNAEAGDGFGSSVAVSGDTVVVGATGERSLATGVNGNQTDNVAFRAGAAYVFTRSGTTWTQQAYLKASNTAEDDIFGYSVAVSGDTAVVGAIGDDSDATGVNGNQTNSGAGDSGAAYVFIRNGTTWMQEAYLKASNTEAFDWFGKTLAVSGDTVVVGAPYENGNATGVNGTETGQLTKAGAAYVFTRNGTSWTQQAYLKASNTAYNNIYGSLDYFGDSVAISGNTVVVGAPSEDSSASGVNGNQTNNDRGESGAAYAFIRNGTTWTQQAYIKANNPAVADQFGSAVAVSGETVVVGSPTKDSSPDQDTGAADITHLFTGPEIYVQQADTNIASGGTKSFGTLAVSDAAEISFDLLNLGVADLLLTGTPKVEVTGSSDFTVTAQPASPLASSGGTTSFKVRFAPSSDGAKSATLSIVSNDADESPFVIHLTGTGLPQADLTWTGSNSNVWDLENATNWVLDGTSTSSPFSNLDRVTFNDSTAATVNTVSIAQAVSPASITVDASEDYTFGGAGITGGATLTKNGTGTLTLTNSNTNTGAVAINAGTLRVGDGGSSGSPGSGRIAVNGGQLIVNRSDDFELPNHITGTGGFQKLGAGRLRLALGTTDFTGDFVGPVAITAGEIAAARDRCFDLSSGATIAAGAAFDLNGFATTTRITINGSGVNGEGAIRNTGAAGTSRTVRGGLVLASDSTIGGNWGMTNFQVGFPARPSITGNFQLTKVGEGSVSFVETDFHMRDIVIQSGGFVLDIGSVIPSGPGAITVNGGSLDFGVSFDPYPWAATCALPIVLNGGSLTASGGPLHEVSIAAPVQLNASTNTIIVERFAEMSGPDQPLPPARLTLNGAVSGNGSLVMQGFGTLTLAQAPAYTGDTTVIGGDSPYYRGKLKLMASGLNDASAVRINDGPVLELAFSGTDTVSKLFIGNIQQPAGVYNSSHPSGRFAGTGSLTVTNGPVGTPYQLWENSQAIPGTGPDADSDHDGISNAIEYVIGGDPSGPNSDSRALLPVITQNGTTLTCVFRRTDASFANHPAIVKYGSNFTDDWATAQHGVNGVSIVEENDGFGTGVDKITVSIPLADKTKFFAQLRVDIP